MDATPNSGARAPGAPAAVGQGQQGRAALLVPQSAVRGSPRLAASSTATMPVPVFGRAARVGSDPEVADGIDLPDTPGWDIVGLESPLEHVPYLHDDGHAFPQHSHAFHVPVPSIAPAAAKKLPQSIHRIATASTLSLDDSQQDPGPAGTAAALATHDAAAEQLGRARAAMSLACPASLILSSSASASLPRIPDLVPPDSAVSDSTIRTLDRVLHYLRRPDAMPGTYFAFSRNAELRIHPDRCPRPFPLPQAAARALLDGYAIHARVSLAPDACGSLVVLRLYSHGGVGTVSARLRKPRMLDVIIEHPAAHVPETFSGALPADVPAASAFGEWSELCISHVRTFFGGRLRCTLGSQVVIDAKFAYPALHGSLATAPVAAAPSRTTPTAGAAQASRRGTAIDFVVGGPDLAGVHVAHIALHPQPVSGSASASASGSALPAMQPQPPSHTSHVGAPATPAAPPPAPHQSLLYWSAERTNDMANIVEDASHHGAHGAGFCVAAGGSAHHAFLVRHRSVLQELTSSGGFRVLLPLLLAATWSPSSNPDIPAAPHVVRTDEQGGELIARVVSVVVALLESSEKEAHLWLVRRHKGIVLLRGALHRCPAMRLPPQLVTGLMHLGRAASAQPGTSKDELSRDVFALLFDMDIWRSAPAATRDALFAHQREVLVRHGRTAMHCVGVRHAVHELVVHAAAYSRRDQLQLLLLVDMLLALPAGLALCPSLLRALGELDAATSFLANDADFSSGSDRLSLTEAEQMRRSALQQLLACLSLSSVQHSPVLAADLLRLLLRHVSVVAPDPAFCAELCAVPGPICKLLNSGSRELVLLALRTMHAAVLQAGSGSVSVSPTMAGILSHALRAAAGKGLGWSSEVQAALLAFAAGLPLDAVGTCSCMLSPGSRLDRFSGDSVPLAFCAPSDVDYSASIVTGSPHLAPRQMHERGERGRVHDVQSLRYPALLQTVCALLAHKDTPTRQRLDGLQQLSVFFARIVPSALAEALQSASAEGWQQWLLQLCALDEGLTSSGHHDDLLAVRESALEVLADLVVVCMAFSIQDIVLIAAHVEISAAPVADTLLEKTAAPLIQAVSHGTCRPLRLAQDAGAPRGRRVAWAPFGRMLLPRPWGTERIDCERRGSRAVRQQTRRCHCHTLYARHATHGTCIPCAAARAGHDRQWRCPRTQH